MSHTVKIDAHIAEDRRLALTLPLEVPIGDAEVIIVVIPREERRRSTAQDLLKSDIFGMWADRADITDSADFARDLRDRAWKRAE